MTKKVILYCEYDGFDERLDNFIHTTLKPYGENNNSGFDFSEKVRDIEYEIDEEKFEEAKSKLAEYPQIRVQMMNDDDYDEYI